MICDHNESALRFCGRHTFRAGSDAGLSKWIPWPRQDVGVNVETMFGNKNLRVREPEEADLLLEETTSVRILVADDEALIRRLNEEVLVDAGYEVDVTGDGIAAWNLLQLNGYDLLLTDNLMPGMSGMELLLRLHASRMSLPTIMASGTIPTEELKRYPWLQIEARLLKPYSISKLLETVGEVLRAAAAAHGQMELPFYVQHQPAQGVLRQWRF